MMENNKIEIEIKYLEKIAAYYEFPLIVFFGNENIFPPSKLTRNQEIKRKADMYDKLIEFLDVNKESV